MFSTVREAQGALASSGLSDAIEVVQPLLLPAVALVASARAQELASDEDDESPLGASKLFGQPDAFDGFRWPVTYVEAREPGGPGQPRFEPRYWGMNLYAQINLRDVQQFDLSVDLPRRGLLLFFSAGQFGAVYYLPEWVPLVRQSFPDPTLFDVQARPAPLAVELEQIVTVPHPEDSELFEHRAAPWHPTYNEWYHAETAGVRSWLGGHPYWWQGDPRATAEARASARPEPDDVLHLRAGRNWDLLLQVGDDVDIGRVSWWMRPNGANPSAFSRCEVDCCFG